MKKIKYIVLILIMLTFNFNNTITAKASFSMKTYCIIDNNGYFVETVYSSRKDIDKSKYIDTPIPQGLKKPRWDGTQWIEGYVEPTTITPVNKSVTKNYTLTDTSPNNDVTTDKETLIANNIILETGTVYDMNILNVDENSSYVWTTNNDSIATITKKGKIKALKDGVTTIVCTITNQKSEVSTLTANVTVGIDKEKYPNLSDTDIELNIGEKCDLDIENRLSKSIVKFSSTNSSVAKVKTFGGIVTGLSVGKCNVICRITKNNTAIVLKCKVEISE